MWGLVVKLHLVFPFPEAVVGELALPDCSASHGMNDQEGGDTLWWVHFWCIHWISLRREALTLRRRGARGMILWETSC